MYNNLMLTLTSTVIYTVDMIYSVLKARHKIVCDKNTIGFKLFYNTVHKRIKEWSLSWASNKEKIWVSKRKHTPDL